MTYLILDESEDLGKNGSKYFIMLGILIENEKELGRYNKKPAKKQVQEKTS